MAAADMQESWTYAEIQRMPELERAPFMKAAREEADSLHRNGTWTLVELPRGARALTGKWVFTKKRDEHGAVVRHKARWVARGFLQRAGVDFGEIFSNTVNRSVIKMVISMAAGHGWPLYQLDVVTAFLHPKIKETVYVEQPHGFGDGTDRVCKLLKALYGLRQSPREWEHHVKARMAECGYHALRTDPAVLVRRGGVAAGPAGAGIAQVTTIVLIYVDDFIVTGPDADHGRAVIRALFTTKDLGHARFYLGMELSRAGQTITLSQEAYLRRLGEKFQAGGRAVCVLLTVTPQKPGAAGATAPQSPDKTRQSEYLTILGSLMYAMTTTRPDLAYSVGALSRHSANPTAEHLELLKKVLRYAVGTADRALTLGAWRGGPTVIYADADFAGDMATSRSTSGWISLWTSGAAGDTEPGPPGPHRHRRCGGMVQPSSIGGCRIHTGSGIHRPRGSSQTRAF